MSRQSEYTANEKVIIIQEYLDGKGTLKGIAKKYTINKSTLNEWLQKYENHGMNGLEMRKSNQSYSESLKLQVVQDYLSGQHTRRFIIEKYNIRNQSQLQRWISTYNGHSKLKSSHGGPISMTRGRTTTYQERIDIVNFCIANQRDYRKTMEQFHVSYQQVYQWVQKFEKSGLDALQDRRGRKKSSEELTVADVQELAIKKLEYENKRLQAENLFLKKLREFQRRRD